MTSGRFRIALHADCATEIDALASRNLRLWQSASRAIAKVDKLFGRDLDAGQAAAQNWTFMPKAVPGQFEELDLRCVDPEDGLITVIAHVSGDVLYILSADRATGGGRYRAATRAFERGRTFDWADPE
jgi:hypothetical protein